MGASASLPADSPLQCLLNNLSALGLAADLKPTRLIKLCTQNWPTYPLDNQNRWPTYGSFDPNLLWDLYNYCERTGKWAEIPYVHGFFLLRDKPNLCLPCKPQHLIAALKLPTSPSAPDFDPADEPPPYHHPPPHLPVTAQPVETGYQPGPHEEPNCLHPALMHLLSPLLWLSASHIFTLASAGGPSSQPYSHYDRKWLGPSLPHVPLRRLAPTSTNTPPTYIIMDVMSNEVFMYSALLLGLILILYPTHNPDISPCAPSPQRRHSAGSSQMNHDTHFPPFKKTKREKC
ncbi:natural cytotoxicity triggering receptor 3 ligand 1-like [Nomascus leucogenys]|uniref:natural cytotoxicity triggering receptor 3 ligand 1-like n=1 Tax=Nomascus leucogenys TaxID=61853 RepID=UPI00122DC419|nr:natural cytotoxicity triggering receptor 3 ligand 1-like [Nomascus leucogenys]